MLDPPAGRSHLMLDLPAGRSHLMLDSPAGITLTIYDGHTLVTVKMIAEGRHPSNMDGLSHGQGNPHLLGSLHDWDSTTCQTNSNRDSHVGAELDR